MYKRKSQRDMVEESSVRLERMEARFDILEERLDDLKKGQLTETRVVTWLSGVVAFLVTVSLNVFEMKK